MNADAACLAINCTRGGWSSSRPLRSKALITGSVAIATVDTHVAICCMFTGSAPSAPSSATSCDKPATHMNDPNKLSPCLAQ